MRPEQLHRAEVSLPFFPNNQHAQQPGHPRADKPGMMQAVEAGDGWCLWFRDGVPVVWIRQLGAGWVELRWYR